MHQYQGVLWCSFLIPCSGTTHPSLLLEVFVVKGVPLAIAFGPRKYFQGLPFLFVGSPWAINSWVRNIKARPSPCNSGQLCRASPALRLLWNQLMDLASVIVKSPFSLFHSLLPSTFLHHRCISQKHTPICFCQPTL